MGRLLKKSLLVLALFAVVWLAVIIWWQESRTLPTGVDIGLYLFALPLAVLGALWLGARAVRAARAPKPQPLASAPAADEAPAALAKLRIVAVAARAAAGPDAAGIAEALAEQQRPELDPELKTLQGFPIFAARVPQLDDVELYAAARERGAPAEALATAGLRATALLADIAATLTNDAHRRVTELDVPARDEDWPLLRFDIVLPASWPQAARDRARAQVLAAAGVWPDTRVSATEHGARDAMAVDMLLRELASASSSAADAPTWRIVLAADGYVDQDLVAQWDADAMLLTHANPQGRVPGEAAAGVLLGQAHSTSTADATDVHVALSPVTHRQKPADARGAQAEPALADLTRDLVQRAAIAPDSVIHVISDADHRGSRPLEALNVASQLFEHLDTAKDCHAVGVACGHTGVAASLLTLAVASEACMQSEPQPAPQPQPAVVTLTLQDPALRCASLVYRPAASTTA
ncbi:3-oxoacyl-(acyl carrier protein) synthase [Achromobacter spanius]|uniref:hypothetical protein n=1 Tax=Achromobacter spanius TaxID=217203 RepID=UPI000C2C3974|nr:hypothetical protein [Achromobacter spanius]AUA54944.1 hypothetical protein CVS48_02180 [Achromobacter spanius]CAB3637014.1 hypothetical protein LMG5911_01400 [Achromobacter spanius]SPT37939.1 3-oxoacyl-(acyl carrier protein) synthase [Achromobacter denitrificans]VEE57633.1 3-oxoacyl-(acyl carrier protein) synthase [Achromobacter spanius]